jgi:hypothetical protein
VSETPRKYFSFVWTYVVFEFKQKKKILTWPICARLQAEMRGEGRRRRRRRRIYSMQMM